MLLPLWQGFVPPKLRPPKEPKDGAKRSKNRVMHGVSYCTETDHHSMLNRDVDAARKIGYRFLCQLSGGVEKLGHWDQRRICTRDEAALFTIFH